MWLLIDDIRDLNCDVIARTSQAAKKLLKLGNWECICFDHDLGDNSEENGYEILTWAIENKLLCNKIQLVTSNPVGRDKMKVALISEGYYSKDNFNYIKG